MAIKHCTSFSLLLILLAMVSNSESRPVNLCSGADYIPLCQKIVKGQNSPLGATDQVIHLLIKETESAKRLLLQYASSKSQPAQICKECYDDAVFDLQLCLTNQKDHDKGSFNSNLSAALTDYVTCDDAYAEKRQVSPVKKLNKMLRQIADTGLYLETMV